MAFNELEEDVLGMLLNEDESTDLLLATGQLGCDESGSVWDVSRDQLEDLLRDMESRGLVRSQLEPYNGMEPGPALMQPALWWQLTPAGRTVALEAEGKFGP